MALQHARRKWEPGLALAQTAVAVALVVAGSAVAETYPDRPVKIISIHPVGITSDLLARSLQSKLAEGLGQSIIVENRAGANGIVATGVVAKAPPDGYTMLITSSSHIGNALLRKDLPFNTLADFIPITQLAGSYGLALITALPVKSVAELVEIGKIRPLSYATNGPGNTTHVAGLLLAAMAGIKMNAVAYSTNSMITDVVSGNVDMMFVGTVNAEPLVRAGQVKVLATTGTQRSKLLPEVLTMQELGYKDFDVSGYFGLLFPAGTPPDRVKRVQEETVKALAAPEVKTFMDVSDFYIVGSTPAQFTAFLQDDYKVQEKQMRAVGLIGK